MAVRVGTSGWSYDDWVGHVYPKSLESGEWLRFYSHRFPTVEVNSTFYRTPPPATVAGWVEKVRGLPRFELSVKAPQALSQEAMSSGTTDEVRRLAQEWVSAVARPLAASGRLGAILLQLSPGVLRNARTKERLEAAMRVLSIFPLAVEFRNLTWLEGDGLAEEALALCDSQNAAVVMLDGPSFPAVHAGAANHSYVRFHGRNADVWHKGRAFDEDESDARLNRYDYRYSREELLPWASHLAGVEKEKRIVRVYFNNHPGGKAAMDGAVFETLLSEAGADVDRATPGAQRGLDSF